MFPSCETLESKPAPAESRFRAESCRDDSIYVSPVAVAVFFAIQYAGYSPSTALQLSGITSSTSFNRITT
jgi:serine protease inhibitor